MSNEFENNKTDIGESNNAKRLRMLGDSTGENIHLKSDEEVKGEFWPNFWFKYKWHVIIISAFVFIFLIFGIQLLTATKYDVTIMYTGPKYVVNIQDKFQEAFDSFAEDYNEDGEIHTVFTTLVYMTPEQREEAAKGNENDLMALNKANQENYQAFKSQIMSGKVVFYLLDPSMYEDYAEVFANVSDILGYTPDSSLLYSEKAVYLKQTHFGKHFDCFKNLPDDTLICIMDKHVFSDEEELSAAKDLFINIMKFAPFHSMEK